MSNINYLVLEQLNKYERTTPFDKYRTTNYMGFHKLVRDMSESPKTRNAALISDDAAAKKQYNNHLLKQSKRSNSIWKTTLS